MATRSTIAVQHFNGSVSQIYCHWDGYFEHNGEILKHYYNDQNLAEQLVKMGDLSSLGHDLGEKHSFDWFSDDPHLYQRYGATSLWCTFYDRDRGETQVEARKFSNLVEYLNKGRDEEYNYLFMDGEWFVRSNETGGELLALDGFLADSVAFLANAA